jgi:Na+/H+ antiporter NhaA
MASTSMAIANAHQKTDDPALSACWSMSSGFVVPVAIYAAVNRANARALRGWTIPAATDIAFAMGICASLGRAVPASLKTFLLALAIIDDLMAIVVIALFYTEELSTQRQRSAR